MASHATVHWSNSYSLYYSVCVYIYIHMGRAASEFVWQQKLLKQILLFLIYAIYMTNIKS